MPLSSYLSQAEQGLSRSIMTTKQTHKKVLEATCMLIIPLYLREK